MTNERAAVEKYIYKHVKKILKRYKEYNPDGKYLAISIVEDEDGQSIFFHNEYWNEGTDADIPINFFKTKERG